MDICGVGGPPKSTKTHPERQYFNAQSPAELPGVSIFLTGSHKLHSQWHWLARKGFPRTHNADSEQPAGRGKLENKSSFSPAPYIELVSLWASQREA